MLSVKVRCVTSLHPLVSTAVALQVFVPCVQMPPRASLPLSPSLPSSFSLSPPPSPDRPSHQCPFPSVWLVPFLFTQMTLPPPCSFCLSGSPLPRCPPTSAHSIPSLLYLYISLSLPLLPLSLHLCPPYRFLTASLACFLPPSLFSSYAPTAQMPGLVRNSCLAMCHYQVLPSTAGPSWGWGRGGDGGGGGGGGGSGVEGAEWIRHEYSWALVCTTEQKMAPQWRLHPSKKEKKKKEGGG